ncbi:MAG: adenylyltransferase/cytidyltransferase family protein [Patescibacteria group bacterium]|jgi:cytidyltransferase-like protein
MLKFFFKYLIKDKIRLTTFNKLVILKLLKHSLKKSEMPESYLYEYNAKTIQKTLDFMHKKQDTIDSMWLQRGLICENKNFKDTSKIANGSTTTLKQTNGKNYLTDEDLSFIEKNDPEKAKIIRETHLQMEDFYKKALCNKNLIYHPEELAKIGQILNQGLAFKKDFTFHRGEINNSLKLYFNRIGEFKKIDKTGIFVFDEKIDLLVKGSEFIFNLKTAKAIEKKTGGKFYALNPFAKKYIAPNVIRVLNTGVYDLPHLGHASKIKNLKQAIAKNGKLIIGLTSNKNVRGIKNKQVVFLAKDRKTMLESLKYPDKIILEPGNSKIFKEFYNYAQLPFYTKTIYNFKSIFNRTNN